MFGSNGSPRATAMAICCALAAQDCGVMSSSSDCTQRATCVADDGSSVDASTPAPGDGGDASVPEQDATAADGESDGVATGGDGAEASEGDAAGDATVEASTNDANGDAPVDAACVPTATESCTEPVCDAAGYACVAIPPAGWSGPDLLWTGMFGSTEPACPTGYQPTDGNTGPTGTADTCMCRCAASGQSCSVIGMFHSDQVCGVASCRTVTLSATTSGTGACTTVPPTTTCGEDGSFEVSGSAPTPSGGSCVPQVVKTAGSSPSWTTAARVCSWTGSPDIPGGCSAAGEQCVPAGPTPFGPTPCVHQSGDVACPAGYAKKTLLFSSETDSRACSPCTCAGPTGGSCNATIAIWGDTTAGCVGSPVVTYTLGNSCAAYSMAANNPGFAQANFTVTPGTCSVATPSTATGAVTAAGPTTVCCE